MDLARSAILIPLGTTITRLIHTNGSEFDLGLQFYCFVWIDCPNGKFEVDLYVNMILLIFLGH